MLREIVLLTPAIPGSGTSKAGNAYTFTDLQGLMVFEDGRQEVFVYRLFPAKGQAAKEFKAGRYVPTVDLKIDFSSRKLVAELTDLRSVSVSAPAQKAA